jgi:SAM-dependent methyltransferase
MATYLMAGQLSELERLQLQSRVWEPAGTALLDELGLGAGKRAVDMGCGAMSWLRILSHWVGPDGQVVGTDIDGRLLEAGQSFADAEALGNVRLARDDLFDSQLEPGAYDLVHARFQIAPLGRADEQVAAYRRLLKPDGVLVLEEPDSASWHYNPPAPAAERLIALILEAFQRGGGDFDSGRRLRQLLAGVAAEPAVRAHVYALPPGHPYLQLPLQFARSLEGRLHQIVSSQELDRLRAEAAQEVADPNRWGTTFTLIQAFGRVN